MHFLVANPFAYRHKKRHLLLTIVILCYYICKISNALPAKLVLFPTTPGEEPTEISGSDCPYGAAFTNTDIEDVQFSCACITGVWAFYEGACKRPALIAAGVDNHCFEMQFKISKVALLSFPRSTEDSGASSVAVFSKDMSLLNGRILLEGGYIETGFVDKSTPLKKDMSFVTTGKSPWTVKRTSGSCIQPEAQSSDNFYCSFGISDGKIDAVDISGSCNDSSIENIKPLICSQFLTGPGKCPYSPLVFTDKYKQTRYPRDTAQLGRVFLSGSQKLKNYTVNNDTNDDDDGVWPSNSSVEIRSEIWNYMMGQAERLSGLRDDKKVRHRILEFQLLEMCKRLLQNVCPDHYIKDTVYDVATEVFINVQKKAFNFQEVEMDYPTATRIQNALKKCLSNLTQPYPFLDRRSTYYNETDVGVCPMELGLFRKYDSTGELSVAPNISSMSHDPLIDTVWHIFTHAHSACYSFFIHSDHHRFTALMVPLFTNAINDIWYRGDFALQKLPDPYSNSLGSWYHNMMFINHCSTFARLESNYPWDLLRPQRRKESRRRKRDISQQYQCMKDKYKNDC